MGLRESRYRRHNVSRRDDNCRQVALRHATPDHGSASTRTRAGERSELPHACASRYVPDHAPNCGVACLRDPLGDPPVRIARCSAARRRAARARHRPLAGLAHRVEDDVGLPSSPSGRVRALPVPLPRRRAEREPCAPDHRAAGPPRFHVARPASCNARSVRRRPASSSPYPRLIAPELVTRPGTCAWAPRWSGRLRVPRVTRC